MPCSAVGHIKVVRVHDTLRILVISETHGGSFVETIYLEREHFRNYFDTHYFYTLLYQFLNFLVSIAMLIGNCKCKVITLIMWVDN